MSKVVLNVIAEARQAIRETTAYRESLAGVKSEVGSVEHASRGLGSAEAALVSHVRGAVAGMREQSRSAATLAVEQARVASRTRETARDIDRAARGAIAGSGAFHHLGRQIAFASGAFIGAAGFTEVVRESVHEAISLNAELHRTDVTFGRSAGVVKRWSETTADAFGLARGESLKWSNQFGAMLRALGVGQRQAAVLSRDLVQRAADIASLRNIDPTVVLTAFTQGLAGRGRALRQYGIVLDDTRLKGEAFTSGIAKSTVDLGKVRDAQTAVAIATAKLNEAEAKYGAGTTQVAAATLTLHSAQGKLEGALHGSTGKLTAQQKALAAHAIILKDSANASGEFGRNSERLGEQLKTAHAQIKGIEETLGQALIPVLEKELKLGTEWLSDSRNQAEVQRDLREAVHLVEAALQAVYEIGKRLEPVIRGVTKATGGARNAFELLLALGIAKKLGLIRLAIAALVPAEAAATTGMVALDAAFLAGGTRAAATARGVLALRAAILSLSGPAVLAAAGSVAAILATKGDQGPGPPGDPNLGRDVGSTYPLLDAIGNDFNYPRGYSQQEQRVYELYRAGKISAAEAERRLKKLKGATGGSSGAAAAASPSRQGAVGTAARGSQKQRALVATAEELGPGSGGIYVWGGKGPKNYDCSGYLQDIYRRNGISIPGDTRSQWNDPNAIDVPKGSEQPGDGVYFVGSLSGKNAGPPPGHVGIYIGAGKFIEYYSRGKPARVNFLANKSDYMGARRWVKVESSSKGAGATPSTSGSAGATKPPKKKLVVGKSGEATASSELIPANLRLKLAEAQLTKSNADDIRVLGQIEAYLEQRLKKEKNTSGSSCSRRSSRRAPTSHRSRDRGANGEPRSPRSNASFRASSRS
jgi:cell wall-associated NlpC family hydrolase